MEGANILQTGTHIDLLLTDWNMSGSRLDCVVLTTITRVLHPELPVILRAASNEASDRVPPANPPITIIHKPYDSKHLLELVCCLLERDTSNLGSPGVTG